MPEYPDYLEFHENYDCSVINKNVTILFNYIEDKKRGVYGRAKARMEDCQSADECGIHDKSGGYQWNKCPIHGKTINQIYNR